jgi:hypothetical protein
MGPRPRTGALDSVVAGGGGRGGKGGGKKAGTKKSPPAQKKPQSSRYVNKAAGAAASEKARSGSVERDEKKSSPSSTSSPSATPTPYSSLKELSVGLSVGVRGGLVGKVAWTGSVHYAAGDWVGVVLDEPAGKNNGTVKGVAYFECPAQHGLMLRPAECLKLI